jgi:hypothetical protein
VKRERCYPQPYCRCQRAVISRRYQNDASVSAAPFAVEQVTNVDFLPALAGRRRTIEMQCAALIH